VVSDLDNLEVAEDRIADQRCLLALRPLRLERERAPRLFRGRNPRLNGQAGPLRTQISSRTATGTGFLTSRQCANRELIVAPGENTQNRLVTVSASRSVRRFAWRINVDRCVCSFVLGNKDKVIIHRTEPAFAWPRDLGINTKHSKPRMIRTPSARYRACRASSSLYSEPSPAGAQETRQTAQRYRRGRRTRIEHDASRHWRMQPSMSKEVPLLAAAATPPSSYAKHVGESHPPGRRACGATAIGGTLGDGQVSERRPARADPSSKDFPRRQLLLRRTPLPTNRPQVAEDHGCVPARSGLRGRARSGRRQSRRCLAAAAVFRPPGQLP